MLPSHPGTSPILSMWNKDLPRILVHDCKTRAHMRAQCFSLIQASRINLRNNFFYLFEIGLEKINLRNDMFYLFLNSWPKQKVRVSNAFGANGNSPRILLRNELKVTHLRWRSPTCGFLRFSAKIFGFLRKAARSKCWNFQEKARICENLWFFFCENLRFGLSLSP